MTSRRIHVLPLAVLAACHLAHVPPEPRSPDGALRAVASLEVDCSPFPEDDWSPLNVGFSGTGVVVDERHIVTAAHVVGCAAIPSVHATMADGRRLRVNVVRDDHTFTDQVTGEDFDLAILEIASADTFRLGLAPPTIAPDGTTAFSPFESWCAGTRRGLVCGETSLMDWRAAVVGFATKMGDSGAGVYDASGRLVGVVTAGTLDASPSMSIVTRIPAGYLGGI